MLLLDFGSSLHAVHEWHFDVHEHQVNVLLVGHFDGLLSVLGTAVFIVASQDVGHQDVVAVVVFCYKYFLHLSYDF